MGRRRRLAPRRRTGPFILKDFISGEYLALDKNPDYWAHDERYPQNKLPYADKLKYLVIPDEAEAIDRMRAGKIDVMNNISYQGRKPWLKQTPEIMSNPIFGRADNNFTAAGWNEAI
jgi:ABC-type transport system substrate-binding protein